MRKLLSELGAGPRYQLSFEGRVMTATNNLKPIAKRLYKGDRQKLINQN